MIVKLTNYWHTMPVKSPTPEKDLAELARAFKALSNPNRLAMYLALLHNREPGVKTCALQDLLDRLHIGAPTVSHHIKELVTAGLVEVEREGKFIRCRLGGDMRGRLAKLFAPGEH